MTTVTTLRAAPRSDLAVHSSRVVGPDHYLAAVAVVYRAGVETSIGCDVSGLRVLHVLVLTLPIAADENFATPGRSGRVDDRAIKYADAPAKDAYRTTYAAFPVWQHRTVGIDGVGIDGVGIERHQRTAGLGGLRCAAIGKGDGGRHLDPGVFQRGAGGADHFSL